MNINTEENWHLLDDVCTRKAGPWSDKSNKLQLKYSLKKYYKNVTEELVEIYWEAALKKYEKGDYYIPQGRDYEAEEQYARDMGWKG